MAAPTAVLNPPIKHNCPQIAWPISSASVPANSTLLVLILTTDVGARGLGIYMGTTMVVDACGDSVSVIQNVDKGGVSHWDGGVWETNVTITNNQLTLPCTALLFHNVTGSDIPISICS